MSECLFCSTWSQILWFLIVTRACCLVLSFVTQTLSGHAIIWKKYGCARWTLSSPLSNKQKTLERWRCIQNTMICFLFYFGFIGGIHIQANLFRNLFTHTHSMSYFVAYDIIKNKMKRVMIKLLSCHNEKKIRFEFEVNRYIYTHAKDKKDVI